MFPDSAQRLQILNLFPKEFKQGYKLYQQHKLPPTYVGDDSGWYILDNKSTIKFNINE